MITRRFMMIGGAVALALSTTAAMAQPADTAKLRDELMALEKGSWDFLRDNNATTAC